ncbi:hypothetical protein PIB30_077393 [Stylosanthes scabra]|uniref:Uncharacterized protein n=1 Tax=Stylosanthes scabra TaxID=79078 RepID=A0ABU6ZP79_9FABA|nr:hypothetical protein [Stylosanthes scabra]
MHVDSQVINENANDGEWTHVIKRKGGKKKPIRDMVVGLTNYLPKPRPNRATKNPFFALVNSSKNMASSISITQKKMDSTSGSGSKSASKTPITYSHRKRARLNSLPSSPIEANSNRNTALLVESKDNNPLEEGQVNL